MITHIFRLTSLSSLTIQIYVVAFIKLIGPQSCIFHEKQALRDKMHVFKVMPLNAGDLNFCHMW